MPRDYRIGGGPTARSMGRAIKRAELAFEAKWKDQVCRGEITPIVSEEAREARLEFEQTRDRLARMEAELYKKPPK